MAKVSAIIPGYNCGPYIKETVESVFSQTYRDIELIVVDDGSTDKTGEILKSFGTKLTYIRQDNKGPSAARNRGIREAQGEYIAFLDHDDIWLSTKIEEQIKLFESNRNLALAFSNFYYVDQMGEEKGTLFGNIKPYRGFAFEKLVLQNFIPTSSVVIKKDVLTKVGKFNERFLISQDYDLYLRIAEHHNIDFIDSPLYKYRVHPGGASGRNRKVMLEEAIDIAKFYQNKLGTDNPSLARKLDKSIAKYMFYIAIWALQNTNKKEALKWYLECVKTGAIDCRIIFGSMFFITPKFISDLLVKNLIKIHANI